MDFIEEYNDNFYINKNNLFYETKKYNNEILFKHPKDILINLKKKKSIIIESSSDEDDDYEYIYNDYDYDGECGGKKESKIKSKKQKLNILPTFINTIKGKIIYTNQLKLELEKLKMENKKNPVILGTILDVKNLKDKMKNKKDIMDYIKTYDIIPLLFNYNNKNIIYKNKKKTFFSNASNLIFVTFKIKDDYNYYTEVINKKPYEKLINASEIIKEKNYIISHYIYENFYMFLNTKKHNFEIDNCYVIDKNYELIEQNLSSIKLLNLSDKILLDDFFEILNKCKNYLSIFY